MSTLAPRPETGPLSEQATTSYAYSLLSHHGTRVGRCACADCMNLPAWERTAHQITLASGAPLVRHLTLV